MKFGRMVYNDKISVPFEDEMNRSIRTEVTEKMLFWHLELRPFDNLFSVITSPFLLFNRCNAMNFIRSSLGDYTPVCATFQIFQERQKTVSFEFCAKYPLLTNVVIW